MKMYFPPLISLILAAPSMILVMLTIYSGHHPGFLEDYHVLYVSLAQSSRLPHRARLVLTTCPVQHVHPRAESLERHKLENPGRGTHA